MTSFFKVDNVNDAAVVAPKLMEQYNEYKGFINFPGELKGMMIIKIGYRFGILFHSGFQWKNKLRLVRIFFDTAIFDKITKDRAAKFVDMLSAIGGTMGLLTGFSIISGVEILYFATKIGWNIIQKNQKIIK